MKSNQILQALKLPTYQKAYCSKLAEIFKLISDLKKLPGFTFSLSEIKGNIQAVNSLPEIVQLDGQHRDFYNRNVTAQDNWKDILGTFTEWQEITIGHKSGSYKFSVPVNNDFYFALCNLLDIEYTKEIEPIETPLHTIAINYDVLKDIVKASKFLSKDELRPVFQTVCLHFEPNTLQVVGTDAHRLYFNKPLATDFKDRLEICITEASIKEIAKIKIPCQPIQLIVYPGDVATIAGVKIKLFSDNRYPDFKCVIPEYNQFMEFNRSEMINSIKKVLPAANKSTNQVVLHLNGNIQLHTQDVDFSNECTTSFSYLSKNFIDTDIAFNGKFLIDAFSIFKDKNVKMYHQDGKSYKAAIFSNDVDNVLIMPLMLNI